MTSVTALIERVIFGIIEKRPNFESCDESLKWIKFPIMDNISNYVLSKVHQRYKITIKIKI